MESQNGWKRLLFQGLLYLALIILVSFDICRNLSHTRERKLFEPEEMIQIDYLSLRDDNEFVHILSELIPTTCPDPVCKQLGITTGFCVYNVTIFADVVAFM